MPSQAELELAWAAGLFDGEGCVYANRGNRRSPSVKLTLDLQMTERSVIERFVKAVGKGRCAEQNRKTSTGKTVWRCQIQSVPDVKEVLALLWPYLSEPKKMQAQAVLDERVDYELSLLSR